MFEHWTLWHTITSIILAGAVPSLKTGFYEGIGGWLSEKIRNHWPFNRRKKKREPNHLIQIGKLTQQVMDLKSWRKSVTKELKDTKKLLVSCQGERTVCTTRLDSLLYRVAKLEKRA